MPVLPSQRPTRTIQLPNPEGAEVEIIDTLTIGDFVGINDGTIIDGTQILVKMLPKIIKSWNLTDEQGNTLEITAETIHLLPVESMQALNEHFVELTEDKKKGTKNTQQ